MLNGLLSIDNRLEYLTENGDMLPQLKELAPGRNAAVSMDAIPTGFMTGRSKARQILLNAVAALAACDAYAATQPAPWSGDCSVARHAALQANVELAKSNVGMLGKCKTKNFCWMLKIKRKMACTVHGQKYY